VIEAQKIYFGHVLNKFDATNRSGDRFTAKVSDKVADKRFTSEM
jgi:hypothetical protein